MLARGCDQHDHGRDDGGESDQGRPGLVREAAPGDPDQAPRHATATAQRPPGAGRGSPRCPRPGRARRPRPAARHTRRGPPARHERGGDVGTRRDGHPAQVEPEGPVDEHRLAVAVGGVLLEALDEQAEGGDQAAHDDDAGPEPALLRHEQPRRVEHHGCRREPPDGAVPRLGGLGGQPLPDGETGQAEVDRRPDREGRAGRGEQGRVGGQRPARGLGDPGADDPDPGERPEDAEDLGDGHRALAQAVGWQGAGAGHGGHGAHCTTRCRAAESPRPTGHAGTTAGGAPALSEAVYRSLVRCVPG